MQLGLRRKEPVAVSVHRVRRRLPRGARRAEGGDRSGVRLAGADCGARRTANERVRGVAPRTVDVAARVPRAERCLEVLAGRVSDGRREDEDLAAGRTGVADGVGDADRDGRRIHRRIHAVTCDCCLQSARAGGDESNGAGGGSDGAHACRAAGEGLVARARRCGARERWCGCVAVVGRRIRT